MNIIKPRNDVMFKLIFGREENKDILKRFLSDMLRLPYDGITDITIENPELISPSPDGKLTRLDLKVHTEKEIIDTEIQLTKQEFYDDRIVLYWSRMYSEQIKSGDEYTKLKKCVSLNILDYVRFEDTKEYYSLFLPMESSRHTLLTDKMEFHYYELPKIKDKDYSANPDIMWMKLLSCNREEELDMLAENVKIPEIQKGIDLVKSLSGDVTVQAMARMREEAEIDYMLGMSYAKDEGRKEGLEKGRMEGMEKGMEKGLEKGISGLLEQLRGAGIDESLLKNAAEQARKQQ